MLAAILTTLLLFDPITPLQTYNSVDHGIMVNVTIPEAINVGKVVLLDYENNQLAPPATVTNGTHDLLSRIPEIKDLKEAAWIQLYVMNHAIHSPLVIQPMTSREVPIVEEVLRPDGEATHIKIVGWKDEAEEDDSDVPFVSGWRVYMDEEAIIETSEGDIRIALRPDEAPNTVWNFRELAKGGLYQNTSFHRIVPMASRGHPFVIQGGDPTGTGFGGPGYWLPIERSELPHDFGVISMARAGNPDSAGSQFFICLSRAGTAHLDTQYCSFGELVLGDDVVRKIAALPLADPSTGKPIHAPDISTIRFAPAPPKVAKTVKGNGT